MKRLFAVTLSLGVLVACTNEDNFGAKQADANCYQVERCDGLDDWGFDDRAECEDAFADGWETAEDLLDLFGCEVDYSSDGACVREVRFASCAEWDDGEFEACDEMTDHC